jgi:hypothetical protein
MAARAIEAVLTVVFALLLGGAFLWATGVPFADAFLSRAPGLFVAGFWVGLLAWIALLVISAIRGRGSERRRFNNLTCAAGAAVLNFLVLTIIGFALGGYSILLSIASAMAGAAFVAAAGLATLVVWAVLRRKTAVER